MRRIAVKLGRTRELSLVAFLRAGDSFRICAETHRWPPLSTFNSFLQCGVDDTGDDCMEWRPFELREGEYATAIVEVDPGGAVDPLGARDGDWRAWFTAATAMLRPG